MKKLLERDALRTRPRKVQQGSRYSLVRVAGTRWPLIAYHTGVLQPLLGSGLAIPEIKQVGGEIQEVRYLAVQSGVDLLATSSVIERDGLTDTEGEWIRAMQVLVEQEAEKEDDRSRKSVLRSFEFPDPRVWPNAYRRISLPENPLVVVDWGISQEVSDDTIDDRAEVPSTEGLRARAIPKDQFRFVAFGILVLALAVAAMLILST